MNKTLLLGYGNPDREDDGVAWHVLSRVFRALGRAPCRTWMKASNLTEAIPIFFSCSSSPPS